MISRQELEGKWKQIKGQIREQWSQLTDDDLQKVKGDTEQLVGVIQQKTGQTRREVEQCLERFLSDGQSVVQQASTTARQYVDAANSKIQEGYRQVEEQVESGLSDARDTVRSRPVESVMAAFGAGIVSGVVLALMLRGGQRS
jgi:uncharacterized protein YjbJ (UPF0337 family)